MIWFPKLYRVYRFQEYLLNPRWLTYGVYQLLYSELLKRQHGELHRGDVTELLKDKAIEDEHGNRLPYPEERLDFLVRAMAEFKLCYPALESPNDKWIVPDLLPSDQPERLAFPKEDALRFDFRFDTFLHRHVLSQFIVEHYRDIRDNQAWQHGVCLASRHWDDTLAMVQANYQSRVLSLAVAGPWVRDYFAVLYHSIGKILERMPKLRYVEQLRLDERARIGEEGIRPVDGREEEIPRESYRTLLALEAAGQKQLICEFGTYDLERLLRPLPKKKGNEPETTSTGGSNPPPSGSGLLDRSIATVSALGSVAGGLFTYLSLDDKVAGGVIGVFIGAVILAASAAWLWHRKRSKR
uniref:C-terminal of Roc, COR, domain n=1 Tax=Candidatus Kentrum sp. MB TaxID=2138164 RepID=A0A450XRE2_9GAMM|nr:MAG: C-terminal of Roc, COR, domain [Candidatus Kentron sp. MB]VFK75590.1 MAG: C-terminal of Roc, COR, domain [Candidatus Kentron sp. MB]